MGDLRDKSGDKKRKDEEKKRKKEEDRRRYEMLGRVLQSGRTRAEMSQEALSKHLGVSFQQVGKYERGEDKIPVLKLYDAAEVLNVPIGEFFRFLPPAAVLRERGPDYDKPPPTPKEIPELLDAVSRIADKNMRQALLAIARGLSAMRPKPEVPKPKNKETKE